MLLSVIRKYVNKHTLRTIYFAIFDYDINYINLIWGHKPRVELSSYKKKVWRIMNFWSRHSHSSPLFRSTIFWNLKTKYLWKIFFLSVSHLITFFLQSLKVGSPSVLMFTIITQSHLLLMRYLSHSIQLILMETHQYLTMPTE